MSRTPRVLPSEVGLEASFDSGRPKGDQIRERLEDLANSLPAGSPIPSDRQLASHFGVARMTVRTEIAALVDEGVLDVRGGRGTFVADEARVPHAWGTSYSAYGVGVEGKPGARLLSREVMPASIRTAKTLEVERGSPVIRVVRLRTLNEDPIGIENVTLPLSRFPGLDQIDFETTSLYAVLAEKWGIKKVRASGVVSARMPTEEESELLNLQPETPCLAISMVNRDFRGDVFEVGRSVYRGDRFDIAAEFKSRIGD